MVSILFFEFERSVLLLLLEIEDFFPNARRPLPRFVNSSFRLRVEQERSTLATISFPHQLSQQLFVPLEPIWELSHDLIDAIEELLKYWASLFELMGRPRELFLDGSEEGLLGRRILRESLVELDSIVTEVSGSIGEFVTVGDPIFLDQNC